MKSVKLFQYKTLSLSGFISPERIIFEIRGAHMRFDASMPVCKG